MNRIVIDKSTIEKRLSDIQAEYEISVENSESTQMLIMHFLMVELGKILSDSIPLSEITNTIQADVRNKLSPAHNICAMHKNGNFEIVSNSSAVKNLIEQEFDVMDKSTHYLSNIPFDDLMKEEANTISTK